MYYYWSTKTWELSTTPTPSSWRVHVSIAIAMAPILGGLLVAFLPVVGFACLGKSAMQMVGFSRHVDARAR